MELVLGFLDDTDSYFPTNYSGSHVHLLLYRCIVTNSICAVSLPEYEKGKPSRLPGLSLSAFGTFAASDLTGDGL